MTRSGAGEAAQDSSSPAAGRGGAKRSSRKPVMYMGSAWPPAGPQRRNFVAAIPKNNAEIESSTEPIA